METEMEGIFDLAILRERGWFNCCNGGSLGEDHLSLLSLVFFFFRTLEISIEE
jgi:hypothetical protein